MQGFTQVLEPCQTQGGISHYAHLFLRVFCLSPQLALSTYFSVVLIASKCECLYCFRVTKVQLTFDQHGFEFKPLLVKGQLQLSSCTVCTQRGPSWDISSFVLKGNISFVTKEQDVPPTQKLITANIHLQHNKECPQNFIQSPQQCYAEGILLSPFYRRG